MPGDLPGDRPLSALQLAAVDLDELATDLTLRARVCTMPYGLPFEAGRFAESLDGVCSRHPILLSTFHLATASLRSSPRPAEIGWRVDDLRSRSGPGDGSGTTASMVPARALAEGALPFDLTGPLVRLVVHRTSDDLFWLTVCSHPAFLDLWSIDRLHAELLASYRQAGQLPESSSCLLPRPTAWTLVGHAPWPSVGSAVSGDRWLTGFEGVSPSPPGHWMFDPEREQDAVDEPHEPHGAPVHRVRWRSAALDDRVGELLRGLAADLSCPIAHVLLAAHAKSVAVASGQRRIAVGLELDCPEAGEEHALGMTTNILPALLPLEAGSWRDLVGEASAASEAAWQNRGTTLPQVHRELAAMKLLSSQFSYRETGEAGLAVAHHAADGHPFAPVYAPVRAEFRQVTGEGITLSLSSGQLTEDQLSELLRAHLTVLDEVLAGDQPHAGYSPLTAGQRRRMFHDWQGPHRDYPRDRCVHQLIEEQVRRSPHAVAVQDAERRLSYQELDQAANRLAQRLRAYGIGRGSVVAVCGRRDAGIVVSFLGILKAGAAYLPLEPSHPSERLAYMLADAGSRLVITDGSYCGRVPDGPWVLWRSEDISADTSFPDTAPDSDVTSDDLTYIIYTSGSTGQPKGVEVPHSGLVNYLRSCQEVFAARGDGGAPLFSSVAFDMVVPNLYTPLIMGQRVCVLSEDLDVMTLAGALTALAPFSFIKLTPGQLRVLGAVLKPDQARALAGTLVVGADAFPSAVLSDWRQIDDTTRMLNEYGPTEASVGNAVYMIDAPVRQGLVPIGRPIQNTTMHVLDASLRPLPAGVAGELFIGGDCVVRGYANRPDLTAERFLPDPFADRPDAHLYRTGDIGRWLPGGSLEFLGRVDDQVKIRGYRVEPTEVEAMLITHPQVSAAIVTAVGQTRETLQLAGYYVADRQLTPAHARAYLEQRLPEYLVPAFLIPIDAVPLDANGKANRAALPRPGRRRDARPRADRRVTPGTLHTVTVACADVLGRVMIDGGTGLASIGAPDFPARTRLAARLAADLGIELSSVLGALIRADDIADLCAELDRANPAAAPPVSSPGR